MSTNNSSDLIGILSTCTICKRLYWSNGFCSHGLKGVVGPSPKSNKTTPTIKKMK